jgi:hypothetical protein
MLQVKDVWPKTISVVSGYQSTNLDDRTCSPPVPVDAVLPNCDRPFPWIVETAENTNALLAKGGVDTVVNGLIRGHDPVPKGTVIDPQEVRERLLIGDGQTSQKFMERLARACAVPLKADGVTGYRTKVRSIDTGKQIAAFLIPGEHVWIWLEFDESGWTQKAAIYRF